MKKYDKVNLVTGVMIAAIAFWAVVVVFSMKPKGELVKAKSAPVVEVGQVWRYETSDPFSDCKFTETITAVSNGYVRYDLVYDNGLRVKNKSQHCSAYRYDYYKLQLD